MDQEPQFFQYRSCSTALARSLSGSINNNSKSETTGRPPALCSEMQRPPVPALSDQAAQHKLV